MRFPRLRLLSTLAAAAGAALSAPSLVLAAEPTPSEISVARRLFDEGKSAEEAARWREAADKFRQAAAIKDTPGIRFHLARCEEERGAFVEALVEYDRARELLDGGVKAPDVERLLPEARERVRAKVALVTLRLPNGTQSANVLLDGKPVSATVLGVPLPLNPGRHRLQASAPGRAAYDKELQLATGEVREVALELPPSAMAPAPAAPAAARPRGEATSGVDTSVPTRTIVLVGEGSLFAAALGTGIVFSVAKGSAQDRVERATDQVLAQVGGSDQAGTACSMPLAGCAELEQARQDRDQAGALALAGFVAAGVSAAAFGLTWWLWPSHSAPAEARVGLAPGRVDVAFSGRF
jgi:hypothetical protein